MKHRLFRCVLPLFAVVTFLPAQSTWYASAVAVPPGNGSFALPFALIQDAIDAASTGDTVLVRPGTYVENLDFGGRNISVRSTGGAAATIIDGNGAFPCAYFGNGESSAALLRGFTLRNGAFVDGGGVHCAYTSPRIEDCLITGNTAVNNGGGAFSLGGAPTFRRCTFTANTSTIEGGGITFTLGSSGRAEACTVNGNTSAYGAGISSNAASPAIADCTVEGNLAGNDGGGFSLVNGGSPVLTGCTVRNNTGGFGAGISVASTSAVITGCSILQNSGLASGGGISCGFGAVQLRNCVIAGNQCNGFGGGAFVTSSTFSALHCTVRGNSAGLPGGGLFVFNGPNPTAGNSIVWGNTPDQASSQPGAAFVITFSDVQGGWAGTGNLNVDPLHVDAAGLDFHLQPASSCRNAGSLALSAGIPTDLDGNPRVLGGAPDLGCDEFAPSYPGTGEDLLLETFVGGAGGSIAVKPGPAGQSFALRLSSPAGTFVGALPLVAATPYPTGLPPAPVFPNLHFDFGNYFLLVDGTAPPPFGIAALPPTGTGLGLTIPPGLAGATLRLQGAVLTPLAANGIYASTDAHEIVF